MPGLDTDHMQNTSGCSFGLVPPSEAQWAQGRAVAQNLASLLGGAVPLSRLRNELNRQASSTSITDKNAERLKNHNHTGWIWDAGDNKVTYWYVFLTLLTFYDHAPFFKMAQNLDLRCIMISDPSALGAGAKPRLESRIKKFKKFTKTTSRIQNKEVHATFVFAGTRRE